MIGDEVGDQSGRLRWQLERLPLCAVRAERTAVCCSPGVMGEGKAREERRFLVGVASGLAEVMNVKEMGHEHW
jgi:hypothetical protein